jgi:hypothetical protein
MSTRDIIEFVVTVLQTEEEEKTKKRETVCIS